MVSVTELTLYQESLEASISGSNHSRRSLAKDLETVQSVMVRDKAFNQASTHPGKASWISLLSLHPALQTIDLFRPSSQPHGGLRYGGASPVDPSKPTVAGTTPDSRRGNSADHNVKTRENANVHDGTGGGGVGVAEMRERKMDGRGLPSPQVRPWLQLTIDKVTDESRAATRSPGRCSPPRITESKEVCQTRRGDGG